MLRALAITLISLSPFVVLDLLGINPINWVLIFLVPAVIYGFVFVLSPFMDFKAIVEYARAFPVPRYSIAAFLLVIAVAAIILIPILMDVAQEYRGRRNPYMAVSLIGFIGFTALATGLRLLIQSKDKGRNARIDFDFKVIRMDAADAKKTSGAGVKEILKKWDDAEIEARKLIDIEYGDGEGIKAMQRFNRGAKRS